MKITGTSLFNILCFGGSYGGSYRGSYGGSSGVATDAALGAANSGSISWKWKGPSLITELQAYFKSCEAVLEVYKMSIVIHEATHTTPRPICHGMVQKKYVGALLKLYIGPPSSMTPVPHR